MSSIRLWAGWTFPLCSLRHMKCFFFPVFRPISIHSLSFLLNMSPLILKDVCVHEGLVRQNMYKHMCTCKHASTRDTHADSRVHTHTRAHAFARRRALIRQTAQRVGVWSFWRENMKTVVVLGAKVCLEPSLGSAPWGPHSQWYSVLKAVIK